MALAKSRHVESQHFERSGMEKGLGKGRVLKEIGTMREYERRDHGSDR